MIEAPKMVPLGPNLSNIGLERPSHAFESNHEIQDANKNLLNQLHQNVNKETNTGSDYIKAFIDNKFVNKIFPDILNYFNIGANSLALVSHIFGLGKGVNKFAKRLANMAVKGFNLGNGIINVVERVYTKNYLSALGYFNDILIAGLVDIEHTYLARGTASGTYNLANALNIANKKDNFGSMEEHVSFTFEGLKNLAANVFSKDIIKNFMDSNKAMYASVAGIFANIGALSWMFSGKVKGPTLLRDIAGVMMDVEQLNFGHYKAGRKNFWMSGVSLAIGTICDYLAKYFDKNLFIPLTFIFDGLGKHLLRLHQNEVEYKKSHSSEGAELALAA
jgi:mRNA-degrading endonuclease HigB of HigAB toxin-antitoxin module